VISKLSDLKEFRSLVENRTLGTKSYRKIEVLYDRTKGLFVPTRRCVLYPFAVPIAAVGMIE